MIRIHYDPQLVEHSVLLAVRDDSSVERELHKVIDPVYAVQDAEEREQAFVQVFAEWFDRLSLGRMVGELVAQRPLISEMVDRCVVREASRRRDEGAELCIRGGRSEPRSLSRAVVIQLCPEAVVDPRRTQPHLRRELLHISDMLDAKFGYDPEAFRSSAPAHSLIRDRYRCLWSTYVEGRLVGEGGMPSRGAETRAAECERLFSERGAGGAMAAFTKVFNARHLTHAGLLDWARDPVTFLHTSKSDCMDRSVGESAESQLREAKPCPTGTMPLQRPPCLSRSQRHVDVAVEEQDTIHG